MSFMTRLRAFLNPTAAQNVNISFNLPDMVERVQGQSPSDLYRTQPHLRTVISFIADNLAQVSLKEYERVSDTDRRRVTGDTLTSLLADPNPDLTEYELIRTLVSDLCLYDTAYWMVSRDADSATGWQIRPVPPAWVTSVRGGTVFAPATYVVDNQRGMTLEVPAESMIVFHGWNPTDPTCGTSPVRTLKDVINEQIQAWTYRTQVWQRGGRIGAWIGRPKDAPAWKDEDRERFKRGWKDFTDHGARAGETPILEDGMTLNRSGFSAREDEFAEVTKLSLETVASVYHVSPVMVGVTDDANYSNTREFRKMLYGQTLGPMMRMIEQRLNKTLLTLVGTAPDCYLEFDVRARVSGDFEEQASVLSTSVGAPWVTPNEARATQNLPALPGGDTLVTPLNVTKGGQASPQDGGAVQSSLAEGKKTNEIVQQWRSRALRTVKSRVGAGQSAGHVCATLAAQLYEDLQGAGLPTKSVSEIASTEFSRLFDDLEEKK